MAAKTKAVKARASVAPSFLYLRGRVFYFRLRLPKWLVCAGVAQEIRICLKTPYLAAAKKTACSLYVLTQQMLDHAKMEDKLTNVPAQIEKFRAYLREQVDAILAGTNKTPISTDQLQVRLDQFLQKKLVEDQEAVDLAPTAEFIAPDAAPQSFTIADVCEEEAKKIQTEIVSGENYDENFNNSIIQLIHQGVLQPEEISENNARVAVKEFMATKVKLNQILAARYKGDYTLERILCPNPARNTGANPIIDQGIPNQASALLLSQLIARYVETNLNDGKWEKRTVADHQNRVSTLLNIIGDKSISKITRDDIRLCRETLRKLPPNWKKLTAKSGMSPTEIIDQNGDGGVLTTKTVNTCIEAISSMFSWAIAEGLMTANVAKNLSLKDDQADIDKRDSLSAEDIKKIFFSNVYKRENFKKPSFYWVPLISLYTGMRLEEICQLHCEDVYKEDGIWLIDIKNESSDGLNDKILKNPNAIRKIPVHTELIERGFIEHLKSKKQAGDIRLFPELNKTDKSPKYGKQVGKFFTKLLRDNGIVGKKSFHSLRHSFSGYFKNLNMHTDMFRQVFGHEIEHLAARQYGDRFSPKQIYDELISKINFDS